MHEPLIPPPEAVFRSRPLCLTEEEKAGQVIRKKQISLAIWGRAILKKLILHRVLTHASRRALHVRVAHRKHRKEESVMKAWTVIGLLFAAAIFATIPISPQVTSRGVELSADQAQAVTYRRARVTARRTARREHRQERRAVRRGTSPQ
jgi:hypothetical protein